MVAKQNTRNRQQNVADINCINIYIQGATTWPPNPPIFVAAVGGAGGAAATVKKGMILSHFIIQFLQAFIWTCPPWM